jgi:hypothetical protein
LKFEINLGGIIPTLANISTPPSRGIFFSSNLSKRLCEEKKDTLAGRAQISSLSFHRNFKNKAQVKPTDFNLAFIQNLQNIEKVPKTPFFPIPQNPLP